MYSTRFTPVIALAVILFLSGLTGFSLELLFVRKLRLLFGSTTFSFALTLMAVFTGFSAGAYLWGKKSGSLKMPFTAGSLLQIGSVIFGFMALYGLNGVEKNFLIASYLVEERHWVFRLILFFLSMAILLPWSFCWGGVLPVILNGARGIGIENNWSIPFFYSMTLVGGCAGIIAILFFLIPLCGFFYSFLASIGFGLTAGCLLLLMSIRAKAPVSRKTGEVVETNQRNSTPLPLAHLTAAFISGLCSIGLELLWLRMFSLVDQNSVYTVAVILIVYNLAIICGSFVVVFFIKRELLRNALLFISLCAGGILIYLTPFIFIASTEGILPLPQKSTWLDYLFHLGGIALPILFLPSLMIGLVFPLLLSSVRGENGKIGGHIGRLIAINTVGTILGTLFFGFFADSTLGLWKSIWIIGIFYAGTGFLFLGYRRSWSRALIFIPASILMIISGSVLYVKLPLMDKNVSGRGMRVIESVESAGAAVAVVGNDDRMHLLINNQYSLGSNEQIGLKQSQALLPMLLHPDPKKICFIGMGTGITAGAALRLPVDSVVVCEIVPGVVKLAKKYFRQYTGSLFSDSRVKIYPEDGRTYLSYSKRRFDVIVADLFIPWLSGAGTIYSSEYYDIVRNRLNANGIFAQWLPLYQLSETDFGVIVKTLTSIFPNVTLWRLNFDHRQPVVVAIAQLNDAPVNTALLKQRLSDIRNSPYAPLFETFENHQEPGSIFSLYCGNLTIAPGLWRHFLVNTDDRLPIEFLSPKKQLYFSNTETGMLVNDRYVRLCGELLDKSPIEADPFCGTIDSLGLSFIKIGFELQQKALGIANMMR